MRTFAPKFQIMIINRLKNLILNTLLSCCLTPVQAQEEDVIEHLGNKYVIHVDQLKPDTEMTLLDVLHICPELMASDGKTLTADYLLSVDDIMLSVDYEPLLESIKACELSEVVVCTYGAVNNATDGVQGSIDLAFKEGEGLTGKIGVNGSTYGNGKALCRHRQPRRERDGEEFRAGKPALRQDHHRDGRQGEHAPRHGERHGVRRLADDQPRPGETETLAGLRRLEAPRGRR